MKIALEFKEEDFKSMASFRKAVKNQLGSDIYVGTDNLCVYFDYPKTLIAMLRPYPKKVQLEFNLVSS